MRERLLKLSEISGALLGLLLFFSPAVEGHEGPDISSDELTTTLKGGLTLAAIVVAILLIVFSLILIVLCWFNCCSKCVG